MEDEDMSKLMRLRLLRDAVQNHSRICKEASKVYFVLLIVFFILFFYDRGMDLIDIYLD